MSILVLPPEVIEAIAVNTVVAGFPTTIAAFAQTCRTIRAIIYNTSDHQLWREVFLAVFDDPRACHYIDTADFDWGSEFKRRTWAAGYLCTHTCLLPVQKPHALRSRTTAIEHPELPDTSPAENARLLYTLLSVIKTSAPASSPHGFEDLHNLTHAHNLPYTHQHTPLIVLPAFHGPSLNVEWLRTTLERGLPPSIIAKVSGEFFDETWLVTPEAQALCQLICCTGFMPVPQLQEEPESGSISSSTKRKAKRKSRKKVNQAPLDMSVDAQQKRARYRARERVYDLNYLKRRRHWGPFRPVMPSALPPPSSSSPSADANPDRNPDFSAPLRKRREPTAAQLLPDWTWLAAARIICEANMRTQGPAQDNVEELCQWDGVREYAWIHTAEGKDPAEEDVTAQGKATQVRDEEVQGWDWAGVEGVWRRCVSWLDYTDLISIWRLIARQNVGEFDDPDLEEAMLIVPLRLRIVGYGPPAIPTHVDRPTIKVEGEMGGAGWVGVPEVNDDVRKIHGTVSTIADGSIRWSLYSSHEDSNTDQWVSEAIQVGGVGSAMGVLGMWTGAFHEDDDPLGE
ncbi:hypothetical protein BKA93DRAFT_721777 [Sparassis latifolia]